MKRWKRSFISLLLCLVVVSSHGQNLPIGSWRTHASYYNIQEIINGNDKIIASSSFGLFYVDLSSDAIEILSKQDGFSDVGVTTMAYDEQTNIFVSGYESGLIDFFINGKVTTVNDLYKSSLVGSKTINDIVIHDGHVYVGCSFGILDIGQDSFTLTENFRSIGPEGADAEVYEMLIRNNQLFAITNHGIQHGQLSQNLKDFNNWTLDPNDSSSFKSLVNYNDSPHCIMNGSSIAQFINGQWEVISTHNRNLKSLIASPQGLFALSENHLLKMEGGNLTVDRILTEEINTVHYHNGFWFGHSENGLEDPNRQFIVPNGPVNDHMTRVRYIDGQVYGFYGVWPEQYQGLTDSLGYELFDNSQWQHQTIDGFYNISDGAYFNNKLYLSSIGYGIYDHQLGQPVAEISENRLGSGAIIPEMAVDQKLYAISWLHDNSLFIIDENDEVSAIPDSEVTTSYPQGIRISNGGTIWITNSAYEQRFQLAPPVLNSSQVILLYPDENLFRDLSSSDGIRGTFINSLTITQNDEAWIATNGGPVIFSEATFIFDGNQRGIAPIYDNQLLFADENINYITSDGGNRIWISTDDGLWILNNSLTSIEEHFTIENSPLPSHKILNMTYNSRNGEMFILTDKGLASYRSASSSGRRNHSNVNIFPNPVRPGYTGLVGISGVVENASVKITDINGKLVKTLQTNGGTASWDLLDYNARRVSTGVYVVFSSDGDGEDAYIGKIAVIN